VAVTVRHATRADAARVAEFAVALFELHAEWNPRRFTQIATRESAERFYGDHAQNGLVLVAEANSEEVVGFAYFEYQPTSYTGLARKVLWLHDIYVEPDERGKGAGSALIAGVREEAKQLGANKVLLSVAIQNSAGHRLFERNGFEKTMDEMMLVID
jgi:GNAT superfamily N-acetyltransferase